MLTVALKTVPHVARALRALRVDGEAASAASKIGEATSSGGKRAYTDKSGESVWRYDGDDAYIDRWVGGEWRTYGPFPRRGR